MIISCPNCGAACEFAQPFAYHAGFGDTAFLYNESGNCTLVWGVYDAAYIALTGDRDPWQPSTEVQQDLESRLPASPHGDRWSFSSPARCKVCKHPIGGPLSSGDLYYLEFPGSIILGRAGLPSTLTDYLKP
jgi:hypothetical protein